MDIIVCLILSVLIYRRAKAQNQSAWLWAIGHFFVWFIFEISGLIIGAFVLGHNLDDIARIFTQRDSSLLPIIPFGLGAAAIASFSMFQILKRVGTKAQYESEILDDPHEEEKPNLDYFR